MTFEQSAVLADVVSSVAILASLGFVVFQLRQAELLNRAKARHDISVFAHDLSKFQAEHADRFVKVYGNEPLSDADRHFRSWSHMQIYLHAETYFRHQQLGLMPPSHWSAYGRFIQGYAATPGFRDGWQDVRHAFADDYVAWMDRQMADAA